MDIIGNVVYELTPDQQRVLKIEGDSAVLDDIDLQGLTERTQQRKAELLATAVGYDIEEELARVEADETAIKQMAEVLGPRLTELGLIKAGFLD